MIASGIHSKDINGALVQLDRQGLADNELPLLQHVALAAPTADHI
jgi:hypothetical protein